MGAEVGIHFAGFKVLGHGCACDEGIKIKMPGDAVIGVAFFVQPVG
ncbi:hypothetical protein IMSAG025_02242 [Muribaculaceae bacterium]|nr:hypothetical protein IMSAG025_02242 [Muribaculaceae bacterium]